VHEQSRQRTAQRARQVHRREQHFHRHLEREVSLHDVLQLPAVVVEEPFLERDLRETHPKHMPVGHQRVFPFRLRNALQDRADDPPPAHGFDRAVTPEITIEVAEVAHLVRRLVSVGIPVQGHIGLTPQSVNTLGGYGLQGKTAGAAKKLLDDAIALDEAGAFSIVLEKVPEQLAAEVTRSVDAITIGIGAGPSCDGQVLVTYDMLNLCSLDMQKPRFVKIFADLGNQALAAISQYSAEVKAGSFPTAENSFRMGPQEEAELKAILGDKAK